jgi:DNA-binding NtrC family response regulator
MARILVIDDDASYRTLLREFIEDKGHTVMEAEPADAGTAIFLREKIDLVISDLMMPVKSGMVLLHELKQFNPKVLFIMVTGFPGVESAIEAGKEGAYDYLVKPVEMSQLATVMNRALATVELRSNLSTMHGLNVALLVSIPFWIILGVVIRMLFLH